MLEKKINLNSQSAIDIALENLRNKKHKKISEPIFVEEVFENKKPLVEVINLKKQFYQRKNPFVVFENLNFNIYEHENVAFLGKNGAGKTTLSEIIAGINFQDEGKIKYNFGYKKDFREQIGIQFQDSSYPSGLKTKDVIDFIVQVYGAKLTRLERNNIIKILGIDEFYNRKAYQLSGGQQQRLNCLLAILHTPKFLILDELSTGLDISIRLELQQFLKNFIKEKNMTLMLVSHNVDEIDYLCDRIIILVEGKIMVNATKTKIVEKFGSIEKCIEKYI